MQQDVQKARPTASPLVTNRLAFSLLKQHGMIGRDILDLGAGSGNFTKILIAERGKQGIKPGDGLYACDVETGAFTVPEVEILACNIDKGLPYPDAKFDAIVAIEVLEHTRSPYFVLQEIARTLKPGGMLIFSVPNVGHMLSRLSFVSSGHYTLYPSPSIKPENAGRICGHIAPLAYQYWHYGIRGAGLTKVTLHQDRMKKGAAALALLFWPWLRLSTALRLRTLRNDPPLHAETDAVTQEANSWNALTSRSLVFSAFKAAS